MCHHYLQALAAAAEEPQDEPEPGPREENEATSPVGEPVPV